MAAAAATTVAARKSVWLIGLVLFAGLIVWAITYSLGSRYRISAEEARRRIAEGRIDCVLDVRTAFERQRLGFYPGSLHIPSSELEAKVETLVPLKTSRLLVYCNTGQRARLATEKLHRLGYRNAVYIATPHTSLFD